MAVNRGRFRLASAYASEAFEMARFVGDEGLQAWVRGTQSFAVYYAGDHVAEGLGWTSGMRLFKKQTSDLHSVYAALDATGRRGSPKIELNGRSPAALIRKYGAPEPTRDVGPGCRAISTSYGVATPRSSNT